MDMSTIRFHPANHILRHYHQHGAPIMLATQPWTTQCIHAALLWGAHKSAQDHKTFLCKDMMVMIKAGQWIVLWFDMVADWKALRISPIGVIPQCEHRPQPIVDYTFLGVNEDTQPIATMEAMQFGKTLEHLLHRIVDADPRRGLIYLSKIDLANGFYRVGFHVPDIPKLGVVLPRMDNEHPTVAFPLTLPMGWTNSPPIFSTATETTVDITNQKALHCSPTTAHGLEKIAATPPSATPQTSATIPKLQYMARPTQSCTTYTQWGHPPLTYVDMFLNDFISLAQGNATRRCMLLRQLLHSIDQVFRPLDSTDTAHRKEPVSIKNSSAAMQHGPPPRPFSGGS